jgi:hypothetical protein
MRVSHTVFRNASTVLDSTMPHCPRPGVPFFCFRRMLVREAVRPPVCFYRPGKAAYLRPRASSEIDGGVLFVAASHEQMGISLGHCMVTLFAPSTV